MSRGAGSGSRGGGIRRGSPGIGRRSSGGPAFGGAGSPRRAWRPFRRRGYYGGGYGPSYGYGPGYGHYPRWRRPRYYMGCSGFAVVLFVIVVLVILL